MAVTADRHPADGAGKNHRRHQQRETSLDKRRGPGVRLIEDHPHIMAR